MPFTLGASVEGKGELEGVPVLVRRILAVNNIHDAVVLQSVRFRRNKMIEDFRHRVTACHATRDRY